MNMIRKEILLSLLIVLISGTVHAETLPHGLQKSICKSGTTVKSAPPIWSLDPAVGKEAFTNLVGSTNFCTNEKVTLTGLGNVLSDEVTCICTTQAQMDKVGCERADQTQPTVTTVIDKSKTGCLSGSVTVSKCATNPEAAYEVACKQGRNMSRIAPTSVAAQPPAPTVGKTVTVGKELSVVAPPNPLSQKGGTSPDLAGNAGYQGGQQNTGFNAPPYGGYTHSGFGSGANGYSSGYGSPFANVTPAPSNYFAAPPPNPPPPRNVSSPPTIAIQPVLASQPLSILQPSTPVEQSSIAQQLLNALRGTASTLSATPIPPAGIPSEATLFVQPRIVVRGNSIVLSWSSVGMKTDAPCTVSNKTSVLAQKNEGSKIIPTDASTPRGPMTFTLSCAAHSGAMIRQTAFVTVN